MTKHTAFAMSIVIMVWANAFGATIHIPAEHETIQAAIDAASDGDVISIADGTYRGDGNRNIDFGGKSITVQSENGPEHCIIDCEQEGRGFYFHKGENNDAVLRGLTITNGNGYHDTIPKDGVFVYGGGAIHCNEASPTIADCIIMDSRSMGAWNAPLGGYGGGIYLKDASPHIIRCRIVQNQATYGGGIYCWNSSPTIANCIISGNKGFDAIYKGLIYVGGGAMHCENSSPRLINCTVVGNQLEHYGEETGILHFDGSTPILTNCIVWGNQDGAWIFAGNSPPMVAYSDIQGGVDGEGNIDEDPLFVDAANGDYRLLPKSPCIDAGTAENAPTVDIDDLHRPMGAGFDMGAYEALIETPDSVRSDGGAGDTCFIGTIAHLFDSNNVCGRGSP